MTNKRKPIGGAVLAALPAESPLRKQPCGENKIIAALCEERLRKAAPTILNNRSRK